jgi:xanthine dehydrogenase YagS FAD-binding subunit
VLARSRQGPLVVDLARCYAPIPWLVDEANEFLEGKEPGDENAARAADIILQGVETDTHNAYKVPLAHALIRRAITQLTA